MLATKMSLTSLAFSRRVITITSVSPSWGAGFNEISNFPLTFLQEFQYVSDLGRI